MKIELFENVYLNKNMNIVIDNMIKDNSTKKTAFETYLADYKIEEIETETGSGDSYENYYIDMPTGQIILDDYTLDSSFNLVKDYSHVNYMSFSRYDDAISAADTSSISIYGNYIFDKNYLPFKVYAFVDSIKIQNHVLIANYTIDYMHSFMKLIRQFTGHLVRYSGKKLKKSSIFPVSSISASSATDINAALPLEFKSVKPTIQTYNKSADSFEDFILINNLYNSGIVHFKMQLYNLTGSGERSDREAFCGFFVCGNTNTGTQFGASGINQLLTIDNIFEILNYLIVNQGSLKIANKYYELTDIYFIPYNLYSDTYYQNYQNLLKASAIEMKNINTNGGIVYTYFYKMSIFTSYQSEFMKTIKLTPQLSYKQYGFFSNLHDYVYDGKDKYLQFTIVFTEQEFSILMKSEYGVENIIDYFKYEYPITAENASALQLQKLTRKITNENITLGQEQTAMNGIFSALSNIGGGIAGAATNNPLAAIGGIMGSLQAVGNTSIDLAKLDNQRTLNNGKVYSSNQAKHVNNANNLFNFLFSIVGIKTDSSTTDTPNYTIVINEIHDSGFINDEKMNFKHLLTMELVTYDLNNYLTGINFVKFSNVILSGLFDNDVNAILTATFQTGYKLINFQNLATFKSAIQNNYEI